MSRSPVVLVTGALIGISRAIAIRYGRAWARAGS
jgi:NAD(P)-dependent dehydrogenase (short-subunit alcohol dehydrogenase family)